MSIFATLDRVRAVISALRQDRRGNILMIFGFAMLPITFATGMAIDYGGAMRQQTRLNAIADAAALAAVTQPMMKRNMMDACNYARGTFILQTSDMTGVALNTALDSDFKVVITDTLPNQKTPEVRTCPATGVVDVPSTLPISRTAVVTFRGQSANSFSSVLGIASLTVKGTASAKTTLAPYIDIHMALDTSQSMGLAASDADATALWNRTLSYNKKGCTFGCHVAQSGQTYANETLATDPAYGSPIKLRINVLRDATTDMIQTAIDNTGSNATYRFGLYRIGQSLSTIQALSDQLATVKATASGLTLGPNDAGGTGDTNLVDMTTNMLSKITARGDGTTQNKARAFLFIVTDGVADIKPTSGSCTSGHCTRPIDPATCQQYKDAGITVGIVYTTYLPIKADPTSSSTALNSDYKALVQKFSAPGYTSPNPSDNSNDIAPALQSCASPGWYFEAADGTGIHAAMQRLFTQASQTPTIIK